MPVAVYSQVISDPNDPLYGLLEQWEDRGIIQNLPLLRPYPPQLVRDLLSQVAEHGNRVDRMRASEIRSRISPAPGSFAVVPVVGSAASSGFDGTSRSVTSVGALGFSRPHELVDITARYQSLFIIREEEPQFLSGTREPLDYVEDWAEIEFDSFEIAVRQSLVTSASLGTSSIYGQAAYSRSSFGPFHNDGLVISPQTPATANFSFVWRGDRWTYTNLLYLPVATNHRGDSTGIHDDPDTYPDKYMIVRA
ncbi:MAG: hypothetical protein ACOC4I_05810, partial [Spirochaetota bacterium]